MTEPAYSAEAYLQYRGHEVAVHCISESSKYDYIAWIDGDPKRETESYSVSASLLKAMTVIDGLKKT